MPGPPAWFDCVREDVVSDAQPPNPTDSLGVLADGAAVVARGSSLDASLDQLLDLAQGALGAARSAVLVQDPEQTEPSVAVARGYADATLSGITIAAGGAAALAEAAGRPVGSVDIQGPADTRISLLPLIAGQGGVDRRLGMLIVERTAAPLDDAGRRLLYALADLAAAAVDRAQLLSVASERADWFERLAASDPLTGLANRRVMERALEHELERAGRQGSEVSLTLFDVDGFRSVNDTSGRPVGDRVLQEVGAAIAGSVRLVDTVARLGGDEFAVVAPGSAGMIIARRVMDAIRVLPEVAQRRVSVSAGVARFPAHGGTVDQLLDAAIGAVQEAQAGAPGGLAEARSAQAG